MVRNGTAQLIDTNNTNSIPSGGSDNNETLSFTLPSDLTAGRYELLIKTDINDRIDESDIGDNIQSFFIDVGEPDLVPQQVTIDGTSVLPGTVVAQDYAPGDDITIGWEIWNIDNGRADSSEAGVYLVSSDGTPVTSVFNSTTALDRGDKDTGESSTLSLPGNLAPGRYTVRIAADAAGEVSESTEDNNFYAFEIDVVEAPEPDLVVQQVRIDGSSVLPDQVVSTDYVPGDDLSIEWEIWNIDSGPAGSSRAGVYLVNSSGTPVASVFDSTTSLSGGGKDTAESSTLSLPSDLAAGRYTVRIAADADGDVSESTETNNFYAFEIDVVEASSNTYNLSPGVEIVDEGSRTLTFTVSRSGTNLQSETLYASTYSLAAASTSLGVDKDGDGLVDDDYNGLIDFPVEFIGSAETASFTVTLNDDTHYEGDERFEVFLATADNAGRFDASVVDSSIVTIRDDTDAPAQVTYDLSVDPQSFSEADRTITFTITRSDDSEDASVWFSTVQDAGFDNIGDYDGIGDREVFFAAGDSVETVTLRINEDSAPEADETFGAIVQKSRFDSFTTYEDRTNFTILNDDAGTDSPPVISGATSQSHAPSTLLNMSSIFTVSDPDGDLSTITISDRDTTGGGEWLYNGSPITLGEVWEAPSFTPSELPNLEYRVGTGSNDFTVQAADALDNISGVLFSVHSSGDGGSLPSQVAQVETLLQDPTSNEWAILDALEKGGMLAVERIGAELDLEFDQLVQGLSQTDAQGEILVSTIDGEVLRLRSC